MAFRVFPAVRVGDRFHPLLPGSSRNCGSDLTVEIWKRRIVRVSGSYLITFTCKLGGSCVKARGIIPVKAARDIVR